MSPARSLSHWRPGRRHRVAGHAVAPPVGSGWQAPLAAGTSLNRQAAGGRTRSIGKAGSNPLRPGKGVRRYRRPLRSVVFGPGRSRTPSCLILTGRAPPDTREVAGAEWLRHTGRRSAPTRARGPRRGAVTFCNDGGGRRAGRRGGGERPDRSTGWPGGSIRAGSGSWRRPRPRSVAAIRDAALHWTWTVRPTLSNRRCWRSDAIARKGALRPAEGASLRRVRPSAVLSAFSAYVLMLTGRVSPGSRCRGGLLFSAWLWRESGCIPDRRRS